MSQTCLNCTRLAEPGHEFCSMCLERLDEMVDPKKLQNSDKVEMTDEVNPFWSSSSATGNLLSSDSIAAHLEKDDDNSPINYWYGVYILVFFLFLLILVYV